MPSRQHSSVNQAVKHPTTPNGWNTLLSRAIRRAELSGDVRLNSLRAAMRDNRAEATLRKYGILSDIDLDREFQG